MSSLEEQIRGDVLQALPSLPTETLTLLLEKLISCGVESKEDLQYVREEDISELLRPIQCRKILSAWKAREPHSRQSSPVIELLIPKLTNKPHSIQHPKKFHIQHPKTSHVLHHLA
ncbi:hypothetical protein SKAU_G00234430 [Synaphobranchus kaupii]|uniref:Uncharacterized protein n=1 Tax=Synaphobranchus kaupii TaxID=118154 RepID=A0A9Q1F683_SYNKA|nr:hypothetical protein SKAU_G00234430 [Synaphobranchus kaupii]